MYVYIERSFYRSANAIFGKVGRIASEEVILQLCKCVPILYISLFASKNADKQTERDSKN